MSRILKSKKNQKFTTTFNFVLQKESLSWAAKGLYVYINSLPEDWVLHKTEVQKHAKNGRTSFESAWLELEEHGYLVGADQIRSSGQFAGRDYIFYDLSVEDKAMALGDSPMHVLNEPMHETNIGTDARNQQLLKKQIPQKKHIQNKAYALCVDFWLKEFHPNWTFSPIHGKATKSIIKKIKELLVAAGKEFDDEEVVSTFKYICLHMPEWFKDKDLQKIDSGFNEIIQQIKNSKNGNGNSKKPESKYRN